MNCHPAVAALAAAWVAALTACAPEKEAPPPAGEAGRAAEDAARPAEDAARPAEGEAPSNSETREPPAASRSPARWGGFPLLPDGGFPIAGWCTPPIRETSPARLAEYRDAGFTVLLPALEDPYLEGPNRERLAIASRVGLWAIVRDNRVHPDEATRPGWESRVREVVNAYRSSPALLGYFLADEPSPEIWPSIGRLTSRFAELDPLHPAYTNLYGLGPAGQGHAGQSYRAFQEEFLETARPAFFSIDQYSLLRDRDVPNFAAGLDTTRLSAAQHGAVYWAILQLTPHFHFRDLTVGELLWQAHLSLASGAKGIVWFTYWTPRPDETGYRDGPIDYQGRRTPAYQRVARVNRDVQRLGRAIGSRAAIAVRHHGTLPMGGRPLDGTMPVVGLEGGDLTVGFLVEQASPDTLALVVSRDYRRPVSATVRWRGAAGRFQTAAGNWERLSGSEAAFALEPGGAVLLRLGPEGP